MALKISAMCVCAALMITSIRSIKPEVALAAALAAGAAACILSLDEIKELTKLFREFTENAGIADETAAILLKTCGISISGEYAAQICRDAGEGALAQRIEFSVRITLIALAAPLIREAAELIREIGA